MEIFNLTRIPVAVSDNFLGTDKIKHLKNSRLQKRAAAIKNGCRMEFAALVRRRMQSVADLSAFPVINRDGLTTASLWGSSSINRPGETDET